MDIFDLKNNLESTRESLTNIIKNLNSNLEERNKSLEVTNEKNNSLQQVIRNLETLNKNIQDKHKKIEADYEGSLRKWKSKKKKFQKDLDYQNNLLINNLPFKDYQESENNSYNLNLYDHELHV